jgi:hypothetical protein
MSFKQLQVNDKVVSTDSITGTVWSANLTTLNLFFTSSGQAGGNTGEFYTHVYNTQSSFGTADVQFDIAYCDKDGSGSLFYNDQVTGSSPTRTNYGQYQNLVLGDETKEFVFGNYTGSYFYALSIERARYKQKLLPGTMTLNMSGAAAGLGEISLTDNSKNVTTTTFNEAGRVYQLVSGSAGTVYTTDDANGYSNGFGSYGFFLPDISTILVNGAAIDGNAAARGISAGTTRTFDTNTTNSQLLLRHLSASNSWLVNSEENISSDFIFIRAQNNEFNFSSNPSFISGSTGALLHDSMLNNPQTFITTIGLYNASNELLAVAKLSRPLVKDYTKELLVRVKLDY